MHWLICFFFQNSWNPRKSAEAGPKTIEEVHKEARNEELQNKLQREQVSVRLGCTLTTCCGW